MTLRVNSNAEAITLSCRLQFGDKPDTPLFSNEWADHNKIFVEELARFVRRYEFCESCIFVNYSFSCMALAPEICAARSITNRERVSPQNSANVSLSSTESKGTPMPH